MSTTVRKAVIAAAGFGTRFLPQTKALPKEMLPLVDKPIIQYIVEDLVAAGIKDIIIISGYSKRPIEDHFDTPSKDLLNNLIEGGPAKAHYIDEINAISDMANFAYVRQKGPYGTATPIMCAAPLIGDEPFIFTYADDLIVSDPNPFKQMVKLYEEFGGGILPCINITEEEDFDRYGIVGGSEVRNGVVKLDQILEKPGKVNAPSSFASVGGFLLTPDVFDYIEQGKQNLKPGEEFVAVSSLIEPMIRDGKPFYGCEIKNSSRYDTGKPLDYLKTVFDFAMARDDIGPQLKSYLIEKLENELKQN
jgi:UTP--glucose-1-phosphate uridylyltransferase